MCINHSNGSVIRRGSSFGNSRRQRESEKVCGTFKPWGCFGRGAGALSHLLHRVVIVGSLTRETHSLNENTVDENLTFWYATSFGWWQPASVVEQIKRACIQKFASLYISKFFCSNRKIFSTISSFNSNFNQFKNFLWLTAWFLYVQNNDMAFN